MYPNTLPLYNYFQNSRSTDTETRKRYKGNNLLYFIIIIIIILSRFVKTEFRQQNYQNLYVSLYLFMQLA